MTKLVFYFIIQIVRLVQIGHQIMSEKNYFEKKKIFLVKQSLVRCFRETNGGDKTRPARAFVRARLIFFGLLRVSLSKTEILKD
jgi:hypothetical protein